MLANYCVFKQLTQRRPAAALVWVASLRRYLSWFLGCVDAAHSESTCSAATCSPPKECMPEGDWKMWSTPDPAFNRIARRIWKHCKISSSTKLKFQQSCDDDLLDPPYLLLSFTFLPWICVLPEAWRRRLLLCRKPRRRSAVG